MSMGTRADFYVGKGKDAEWLGSIAFDGYRDNIDAQILHCTSPEAFRHAVAAFLAERDDATLPEQGWPWPWDDSGTTDCSYWHFDGVTWDERRKHYTPCNEAEPEDDEQYDKWLEGREPVQFPNMSSRQKVTFGKRSGLIVIGL
jgi:hypothetical protein